MHIKRSLGKLFQFSSLEFLSDAETRPMTTAPAKVFLQGTINSLRRRRAKYKTRINTRGNTQYVHGVAKISSHAAAITILRLKLVIRRGKPFFFLLQSQRLSFPIPQLLPFSYIVAPKVHKYHSCTPFLFPIAPTSSPLRNT